MDYLIPQTLETERLILRTFVDEDWRDLHGYYSDATCMRYTTGRALSEGEAWRVMASMIGHWTLRGYGPFAVTDKETKAVLGPVGLWFPNDWPEPEIKWGLARQHWGRGYAREAATAVLHLAAKFLADTSLISLIDGENTASIRVATSIGAHFEKEIRFRGSTWCIYRHRKVTAD